MGEENKASATQTASESTDAKPPATGIDSVGELPLVNGEQGMYVKIYAPFKNYYDQPANSISAENDTGPFDILPHHKNFITLISPCEIVVRRVGEEDFKIKVTRAVMHVKADRVVVFLDA